MALYRRDVPESGNCQRGAHWACYGKRGHGHGDGNIIPCECKCHSGDNMGEPEIKAQQRWQSIRDKHNGLVVQITRTTTRSVAAKVIAAGDSQNNRKVVGKRWHIGKTELLEHYRLMDKEVDSVGVTDSTHVSIDSSAHSANGHYNDTPDTLAPEVDAELDLLVDRTVTYVTDHGPVKLYVLSQNVATHAHPINHARAMQIIERGTERGVLESWAIPSYRGVVHLVGLPGSHATYDPIEVPSDKTVKQSFGQIVHKTNQERYEKLTDEQKEEIANLLRDNSTSPRDIAKAYGVTTPVVARVRSEYNVPLTRPVNLPPAEVMAGIREDYTSNMPTKDIRAKYRIGAVPFGRAIKVMGLTREMIARRKPVIVDDALQDMIRQQLDKVEPELPGSESAIEPEATLWDRIAPSVVDEPKTTFIIIALKMVPTEVELTIQAKDIGQAWQYASTLDDVVDVLSVSKVRD